MVPPRRHVSARPPTTGICLKALEPVRRFCKWQLFPQLEASPEFGSMTAIVMGFRWRPDGCAQVFGAARRLKAPGEGNRGQRGMRYGGGSRAGSRISVALRLAIGVRQVAGCQRPAFKIQTLRGLLSTLQTAPARGRMLRGHSFAGAALRPAIQNSIGLPGQHGGGLMTYRTS